MTQSTPENAKARLLSLQKELLAIEASSRESRQPVELDQSSIGRLSRMDALQGQAMALETGRRRDIELKRIAAALNRIEAGDYGYCVVCKEEIEERRLKHDPANPVCVSCATDKG